MAAMRWFSALVTSVAVAMRQDRSVAQLTLQEDLAGKTTCQYVPELGRPDTHDGLAMSTNWKKIVKHEPNTDFLTCKTKCDVDTNCVAFVRRAEDDVGYLGSATAAIMNAQEDPTKLLQVPNDVQLGDCWLLGADKLAKYKLIKEIKNRRFAGKLDKPFRKLSLETKGRISKMFHDRSIEKVTYEKRDCQCEYRYIGLIHEISNETAGSDSRSTLAKCEGEYRYLGKEFAKYGVESLYQRTDGQKFLYLCSKKDENETTLTREWYCMDKEDPNVLQQQASEATTSAKAFFYFFGSALMKFDRCLGEKLERPFDEGPILPSDLAVTKEADPKPLTYPRSPTYALGDFTNSNKEDANLNVPGLRPLQPGQGMLACAAGKKEAEEVKKDFLLKTSTCQLSINNSRVQFAHWLNGGSTGANALIKATAGFMRGTFSFGFWNQERDYTKITKRGLDLWEKVEKAYALINYIQEGKSVTGHNMTEGEKYACAELMVDEVKAAGGIMPKVSQTLAMKPDVVKDAFVRSALKSTQTENPAKSVKFVQDYVKRKLQEAAENQDAVNDPDLVIDDIDEHLELGRTLATGSVAQVLQAKVKSSGKEKDYLCGKGADECDVVLKVVFDSNEQNYLDDWEAIKFLGNTLLWLIHKVIAKSGFMLRTFMTADQVQMAQHGVSAGLDTWQAVKQGLGAVMDEFDLRIEDRNAKKGMDLIKGFNADMNLKKQLGISAVSFDVPKVMMTRSRYIMVQSFAKGDTLTAYHSSITGQVDKLKQWRTHIYPSIIGLYGYLMVEKGFFQGDPHPGNWYWEESSKTLTLIDWGLADDLSGGLARAGRLYVDEKGQVPKIKGKDVDQAYVDSLILKHQCALARFYSDMSDFRRKEKLCQGYKLTGKNTAAVLVPANGPTMLLDGTDVYFHTKYFGRNLTMEQAMQDDFFGTPLFGTGPAKPFILQRRRSTTCLSTDSCGHGWELAMLDGEGAKTYMPIASCTDEACVSTSLAANSQISEKKTCKQKCKDVACLKKCDIFTSAPPAKIGDFTVEPLDYPVCKYLETREEAYKKGATLLGYKTQTMHPVVLALFASLHTNDLMDLKARQENIQQNDPKEAGTKIPDYVAVMLRSLQVFLGMVEDISTENRPPFVPMMVTEFIMDTSPDEMFTFWHIFAKRFMASDQGQQGQCQAALLEDLVDNTLAEIDIDSDDLSLADESE